MLNIIIINLNVILDFTFFSPHNVKLLKFFDIFLNNRGAFYEDNIFFVLRQLLFVVKFYEFVLIDKILDCIYKYFGVSYADRL